MQSMEERKAQGLQATLWISIGMFFIFAYVLAYAGSVAVENGKFPVLSGLLDAVSQMAEGELFFPINNGAVRGVLLAAVFTGVFYVLLRFDTEKNVHFKKGAEKGTGRFMTDKEFKEYNKTYITPEPKTKDEISTNIIMSRHFYRPVAASKIIGNNNVLIVGSSGTGKSRFYVKPNLMQLNASYVVTDPSGELIGSLGTMLQNHGYKIKIFNIQDMEHSNCYNPLEYIRNEAGVNMVIDCFIRNTTKPGNKGDQFFTDAERLLYSACIFYLLDFCPDASKKNFPAMMNMINASQVDENNTSLKSPLDMLFEALPSDSLAWKYYKAFKQAAGKTLKSIIISCVTRLQPFMTPQVVNLTKKDTLDLASIGDEKTALFIITPQADRTYSFLASMLYAQLFETLYFEGDIREAEGKSAATPIPVRCIMDEFANIGEIPEFPQKLATMRKYNISCVPILQDPSQLESMYEKDWRNIIGNCSTCIYLGLNEQQSLEYFSKMLDEGTITEKSRSTSKGKGGGSKSLQQSQRKVMTPGELRRLDRMDCIVFTQNMYPKKDRKFELSEHLRYDEIADSNNSPLRFSYKNLSVFDNTKEETMESRLKAIVEFAKLKESLSVSDPVKVENVKVKPEILEAVDMWELSSNERKELIELYIDECQEQVLESYNDAASFARLDAVPFKLLPELIETVSGILDKRAVVVFTDLKDEWYRGIAVDKDDIGLFDAMNNDYAKQIEVKEPYCHIKIKKRVFESFRSEVLSKLGAQAVQETPRPRYTPPKKKEKEEEIEAPVVEQTIDQSIEDYEMDMGDFI